MNSNQLILLLLLAICLFSCSKEYTPTSQDTQDETVVLAELEVGETVFLSIGSTYGNQESGILPTDDDGFIFLHNANNEQFNKKLRPTGTPGKWVQTSLKFSAGHEIVIETDFSSLGHKPTTASIIVPSKGSFANKEDAIKRKVDDETRYTLDLELAEIPEDNYYHIKPFVYQNGTEVYLDIADITENSQSAFLLTHTHGMLIDYQVLEDVKNLQFDVFPKDVSSPDFSTIYFVLKTVPKAYYDYHKSLTAQKETQQGPFDAPVPTFSNIEGGQGIFVAYQSLIDSVPVR